MDDNIKVTKEELKIRLENELLELKKELSDIAMVDPHAPGGYSPKETNSHVKNDVLDDVDQASEMSNIHNNNAILEILVERKTSVENALERIKDGTYGKCHVCGKDIEDKRLLINAAATACVEHMEI